MPAAPTAWGRLKCTALLSPEILLFGQDLFDVGNTASLVLGAMAAAFEQPCGFPACLWEVRGDRQSVPLSVLDTVLLD